MKNFHIWLENNESWRGKPFPSLLRGLAAEAIKAGSFEEFQRDFLIQIKHGLYWHWTNEPDFTIDPLKGPRDMSSISDGEMTIGKLMITSHLDQWSSYGPKGKGRDYAALIDMSKVPRSAYRQINRGFGNEFFVDDPSLARVIKVYPRNAAFRLDRQHHKLLPRSEEELLDFYQIVTKTENL